MSRSAKSAKDSLGVFRAFRRGAAPPVHDGRTAFAGPRSPRALEHPATNRASVEQPAALPIAAMSPKDRPNIKKVTFALGRAGETYASQAEGRCWVPPTGAIRAFLVD